MSKDFILINIFIILIKIHSSTLCIDFILIKIHPSGGHAGATTSPAERFLTRDLYLRSLTYIVCRSGVPRSGKIGSLRVRDLIRR